MSKPIRSFIAAAPAAQHCPELIRHGPDPADLVPRWQALGPRLAAALAPRLAPVLGGIRPRISLSSDEAMPPLTATSRIVRRHCSTPLTLTIDGLAVLRLIDRAFGGPGQVAPPYPASLPPSARMVGELIEAALTMALGEVLGLESAALTVTPGASELPPPAPGCDLVLAIDQPGTPAWTIKLSLPQAGLVEWLVPRRARPAGPRSADPAAPPFADLPLPLSARLVDMRLPLSAVARLTPGMVLPVAVARAVPVEVGGVVIARGTVGNQDDRIAIKLTHIA